MIAVPAALASWVNLRSLAGLALGVVLAFPLGQCSGERRQHKLEEAQRAVAIAEALKRQNTATEKGAAQSLRDAQAVADAERKLTDAVADLPDETPSVRDVQLTCERLRNQGDDVSNIPACSGPRAADQTPNPARGGGQ